MISQHLKIPTKLPFQALICCLLHTKLAGQTTTTKPLTRGSLLSFQAFSLPSVLSAGLHRQLNQHLRPWTLAKGAPPSPTAACSSIPVIQGHAHAAPSRTHTCTTPAASSLSSHPNTKSKTRSHRGDRFSEALVSGSWAPESDLQSQQGHLQKYGARREAVWKCLPTGEAIYGRVDGQRW